MNNIEHKEWVKNNQEPTEWKMYTIIAVGDNDNMELTERPKNQITRILQRRSRITPVQGSIRIISNQDTKEFGFMEKFSQNPLMLIVRYGGKS